MIVERLKRSTYRGKIAAWSKANAKPLSLHLGERRAPVRQPPDGDLPGAYEVVGDQ